MTAVVLGVAVDTPQHAALGDLLDYTHGQPVSAGAVVRVVPARSQP